MRQKEIKKLVVSKPRVKQKNKLISINSNYFQRFPISGKRRYGNGDMAFYALPPCHDYRFPGVYERKQGYMHLRKIFRYRRLYGLRLFFRTTRQAYNEALAHSP